MSYRKSPEKPEEPDGKTVYYGPCQMCSKTTNKETLANYGTRCYECYERYVVEKVPDGPAVHKDRYGEHRAWAHALKARDGIKLSGAQKAMWRAVLGAGE